ncbi:MAG: HAD family hydrolase [candidate division NC10 bacterium]|nr:HAD family hydrolase [candidate division NC10 bacterium]
MTIKDITFDLWQTLILDSPEGLQKAKEARIQGLQEILIQHGIGVGLAEMEQAYEESGRKLQEIWKKSIDVSIREQVGIFLGCLDHHHLPSFPPEVMAVLMKAYASPILGAMPTLNEGAIETLEGLKGKDYQIGLISNTGRTPGYMLRIVLKRFGLLDYFDVLTFSDEVRIRKPDSRIFHLTLEKMGAISRCSIHIGDDLRADVGGAKGAGMQAIHLRRDEAPPGDSEADGTIGRLQELLGLLSL